MKEQRRTWNTFSNTNICFDFWERTIVELDFSHIDNGGNVIIMENHTIRIINLDESCLYLDVINGIIVGNQSIVFYDPNISDLVKSATNYSTRVTAISRRSSYG